MSGPNCHNCIYSVCDPELWLRSIWKGESIWPRCANHPWFPGQLHDVSGVACRNYRRKPDAPTGDVRLIPLAEGLYAYVDAADYEWLSRWNWHTTSAGYAARHDKGKTVLMHRLIMQPPKGMVVDHVDGSRSNNCRFNLRVCTRAENQRNQRKQRGAFSQYKGVYYQKQRGKIYVQYQFEGHAQKLGNFENEIDAARAYDYKAVELFGEFARVNFPREWPPERRAEVHAQGRKARQQKQKEGRKMRGKEHTAGGAKDRKTTKSAKQSERKDRKRHRPRSKSP
jgi:hypothetical protein